MSGNGDEAKKVTLTSATMPKNWRDAGCLVAAMGMGIVVALVGMQRVALSDLRREVYNRIDTAIVMRNREVEIINQRIRNLEENEDEMRREYGRGGRERDK